MAETVTLTSPITKPNVTALALDKVIIDVTNKSLYITWTGNTGELFSASYPTPSIGSKPSGATLLHSLNIANFSVNSMVKQIFNRLIADGEIAGTITGTPD